MIEIRRDEKCATAYKKKLYNLACRIESLDIKM